ncbi:MAG: outer membrane lipoprotein-sorting protein [Verrucomicrobiia bacterium]
MKWLAFAVLALMLPIAVPADAGETNLTAEAILARVWANRPLKDFSLKARLFVTREKIVPVEILVKNTPEEVRTIYRAGKTQLLVIQPGHGEPRYYLQGAGELRGKRRTEDFLGSHFSDYDLGMPFLRWPNPKLQGEQRVPGRDCYIIETKAAGEPYARVRLWIDKEYFALLRAEAFDENENLVRRFAITSFKRIGEFWIPRGIEIAFVPPGQSLPSEEKSRLEVYEGSYDMQLPVERFSAASFGVGSGAGKSGH